MQHVNLDPTVRAQKVEQFAESVRQNLVRTVITSETDLTLVAPLFLVGQVARQLAVQNANSLAAILGRAISEPTLVDRSAGAECGLLMGLLLAKRPDLAGHILESYSMNTPESVEAMHVMTDALIKVYDEQAQ